MHLVYVLRYKDIDISRCSSMISGMPVYTHQLASGVTASLEQLLADICKFDAAHTELPAFLVFLYNSTKSSCYDLMSITNPDKLEVRVFGRNLAREVDQTIDPWYIFIG